jgi:malonate transporter and related proteins
VTAAVVHKLLAIFLTVGLGWVAGRMRWLDTGADTRDPARVLGNAAFSIFVPALLFRTTARLDFAAMPWRTIAAYFVPAVALVVAVYAWQRWRRAASAHPADPAVRAVAVTFGNSIQLGIPMAAALFGEPGLAIHIALVSVHAVILLSVPTVLAELDLARAQAGDRHPWQTLASTVKSAVVHPVVLPVLAGLAWNLTGWGLHPVVDEVLVALGSAVVPVCLVLIGLSLAYYGVQGQWRGALVITVLKLLVLPALVLAVAHWGFGLAGLPLGMQASSTSTASGSNALIFAQRYGTLQSEATAAIVISTFGVALAVPLWLAVLAWLG